MRLRAKTVPLCISASERSAPDSTGPRQLLQARWSLALETTRDRTGVSGYENPPVYFSNGIKLKAAGEPFGYLNPFAKRSSNRKKVRKYASCVSRSLNRFIEIFCALFHPWGGGIKVVYLLKSVLRDCQQPLPIRNQLTFTPTIRRLSIQTRASRTWIMLQPKILVNA